MQTLIQPTQLPYRFRESSFRRYECHIFAIVSAFPARVVFDPQADEQLSPVTFACRLRDAMRSLVVHSWTTAIDLDKLKENYNQIVVSEQTNGKVAVGSRDALRPVLSPKSIPTVQFDEPQVYTLASPSEDIIHLASQEAKQLLAKLASCRLLANKVRVSGLTDEEAQELEANFDCRVDRLGPTIHTII